MNLERRHPIHLLQSSTEDRMNYFKNVFVSHREIKRAIQDLEEKINPFSDQSLILMLGATGVGKSTTAQQYVAQQHLKLSADSRHLRPAIYMELSPPHKGGFEVGSFYRKALSEYSAPSVGFTLPIIRRLAGNRFITTPAIEMSGRKPEDDALETRFQSYVSQCGTRAVFTDEASNWFVIGKANSERDRNERLKLQANVIKSVVNETQATLVLIGAEDFAELTLISGQLIRRSSIVSMHPYTKNKVDTEEFARAIVGLISHLPIERQFDIEFIVHDLFTQSCGCVGIANDKLVDAMYISLQRGCKMTSDILQRTYFSDRQLKELQQQIEIAETKISKLTKTSVRDKKKETGRPPRNNGSNNLKPGESRPSHRFDAAGRWEDTE